MPLPLMLAGAALKMSPIGAFLKRIPRWVWIVLAVIALVVAGRVYHNHKAGAAITAAEKRGEARAYAAVEKRALALTAKANAISANLRSKNNETVRRIAADADALRVRGPGKASCPSAAFVAASGHSGPAGRPGDAALDQVPDSERVDLIGLPFPDALDFAEAHDRYRAEVLTRRENDTQQDAMIAKE